MTVVGLGTVHLEMGIGGRRRGGARPGEVERSFGYLRWIFGLGGGVLTARGDLSSESKELDEEKGRKVGRGSPARGILARGEGNNCRVRIWTPSESEMSWKRKILTS